MNRIAKGLLAVGLSAGLLLSGSPGEAAPKTVPGCDAAPPSWRRAPEGKFYWDLLSYKAGRYTGRPFAFRLTLRRGGPTEWKNYTFTYNNKGRAMTTGRLNYGVATKVEVWYSGQYCARWTGRVNPLDPTDNVNGPR